MTLLVVLLVVPFDPSQADRGDPPLPQQMYQDAPHPFVPKLQPPPGPFEAFKAVSTIPAIISDPVLDMRVLVLYRTGFYEEGISATIRAYLEILGIPYDAVDTSTDVLTESDLWDGMQHGYYYAVFVTTSPLWYGLTVGEKSLIEDYERSFGVRQVTLYAYPDPWTYGLNPVRIVSGYNDPVWCPGTPLGIPFVAELTPVGYATLNYLRPNGTFSMTGPCIYGYLASPADGADVTPLGLDPSDDTTFLAIFRPGDGREHMVLTIGSFYPAIPPAFIHARLLPYGMINWATRGVFLGQRQVYFAPQPDDVLGWGDCWDPTTHTYIYDICYRNAPADLDNLVARMNSIKSSVPNAASLRIEMPFNAEEVFDGDNPEYVNGHIVPNTLTAKAVELQNQFTWLNHTYSHADLDLASYAVCGPEISRNNSAAATLGFTDYSHATMLTGDYSGMGRTNPSTAPNANLASAAYSLGVRYMLVNESDPLFRNPSPNTGIPHPLQSQILEVPRYANNIFYASTSPAEEVDLYNWIYCPGYATDPINTPPCYDYAYVIDSVTNQALGFLLDFSVNPTMFHMNNLDAYDAAGHTLMTDFIEALYGKYNTYYGANVPVLSLRTQEIGAKMRDRMAYNVAGVSGELRCGDEITLRTVNAGTIPVTGINYGSNVEAYAGQTISHITMADNGTVVIPGATASVAAPVHGLSAVRTGNDVILTWDATTEDTAGQQLSARVYRVSGYAGSAEGVPLSQFTLLAEVAAPSYTHVAAASDPPIYTYAVTAVGDNCWQRESAESERLVKAEWTIKPGYNLLAMPLFAADPSIQGVLGTQLTGGDSVDTGDRVLKFNPATQSYDQIAVYVAGTGTPYDGHWYDVNEFPQHLSTMSLDVHDGLWVQHRAADQRQVVVFGRAATADERRVAITSGPYQVIGSGDLGPLALTTSNLWESGASGGNSLDSGDRLLRFDAATQSYDAIGVLIDGIGTNLDGTWADGWEYPNPSTLTLDPGQGYWFHNRTPASPFYWSYPRP